MMPTSTTYAANLAPVDMRGRYMSVYSLTWNVAYDIGPVAGGIVGVAAALVYLVLALRAKRKEQLEAV